MAGESTSSRPSRAPKTVERFVPAPAVVKEKAEVVIEKGTGTKLGDIEAIADNLKSVGSDDDLLKALHSVLFGGTGKKTTRKRDIRAFNGFAKNSGTTLAARTEKMIEKKTTWTTATLKDLADLFGLEKSGDRDALCKRVIDFLASPSADDVKATGGVKRKREKSSGGEKKVKKASKGKKDKGDKPKRAPSGFILFCGANRAEVLKKSPGLTVPEVGKKLGEMWRAATDATKKKFNDMSEKRKKELASEKPAAAAKKPAAKKEKKAKKEETEDEEEDVVEEEEEEEAEEESPKKKSKK